MIAMARVTGYGEGDDLERELAQQVTDIWERTQRVKNHPRFQAIVSDPEFIAVAQSGNPLALLTDSRLLELADIIFEDDGNPTRGSSDLSGDLPGLPTGEPDGSAPRQTQIYQWTDSSGRLHFSDQGPEQ